MHFFITPDKLTTQLPVDAYGPDSANATTKFNVTSKFQLTQEAKAFACQGGAMMVQHSTQDESLVNIIIEPDRLTNNVPLNVQYYIYRGILKNSFLTEDLGNNTCNIVDENTATNTDLIKRLYEEDAFDDKTCSQIGYDRSLDDARNITDFLNYVDTQVSPIYVKEGEWLGTFSKDHKIGFEVVLKSDSNDFNLAYLRLPYHSIDVSGFTGSEQILQREKILNFIDPCAFFGTHLYARVDYFDSSSDSKKTTTTSPSGTTDDPFLYTKLLDTFVTKNMVYLDIRSEKGYSYNIYGNYKVLETDLNNIQIRTASGDGTFNIQEYQTNNWPILMLESSHATGNVNTFRFKLRIDDNRAPILYLKNYEVLENKYVKITDSESKSSLNFNYVKVKTLIDNGTNPNHTDWTNTVKLRFPNTQSGTSRNYISHYLRVHYFRAEHNNLPNGNGGSPDSVLKNEHYWDSSFCSIDIPELDLDTDLGFVEGANPIYVREPDQEDGTGNFQLNMKHGAFWDDSRVLLYATIQNENPDEFSEKQYLNTFSQKLEFNPARFASSDLKRRLEIICRPYEISSAETIRILGINLYKHTDFGAKAKNYKENAMFLGLSKEELQTIQNVTLLEKEHNRYIFLERQLNNNLEYFETEPDSGNGEVVYRYYKYVVNIQGFDSDYNLETVEPSLNGNPIVVYSRDNQFFSSIEFSQNEPLTVGKNGENEINRVEFHVYQDGIVKVNDNIDFALLDRTSFRIHYKYHDLNDNITQIEGLNENGITENGLELVMANKMQRSRATRSGVINAVPNGFNLFTNYQNENVPGVDARESYENNSGDIVTDGNFNIRKYINKGKKRFLVRLVTDSTNVSNVVSNFFRNENIGFDLDFEETLRLYASPSLAAAILGALIETDDNIISQGFAYKKGSSYPSAEHVNGEALDTNYNTTVELDVNFILALRNFGISLFRIGNTFHDRSNDIYDHEDIVDIREYFKRDSDTKLVDNDNDGIPETTVNVLNSLHSSHLHSTNLVLNDGFKEL